MIRYVYHWYRFLFVAVLLAVLFVSGIFLDTSKTRSPRERRSLASLPENWLFNATETEKYIADHIPFRDKLIDVYFGSGWGLGLGTKSVLLGKKKWLFLNSVSNRNNYDNILIYQNKFVFSQKEKNQIKDNLMRIQAWCQENNILLYLIVPPDKNRVYAHYMPDYILRDDKPGIFDEFLTFIPQGIAVVPLDEDLIKAAQQTDIPFYYKTDTHWSEEGGLLAYRLLMKRIQKDLPNVHAVSVQQFHLIDKPMVFAPYSIARRGYFDKGNLNLPGLVHDNNQVYRHYEYKKRQDIQYKWDTQFRSSDNKSATALPYRVYVIGDSFATYLHPWLSASFKHVRAYRFNEPGKKWGIKFQERQKEMLEDKMDILILSVSDLKLIELTRAF